MKPAPRPHRARLLVALAVRLAAAGWQVPFYLAAWLLGAAVSAAACGWRAGRNPSDGGDDR